VESEPASAATGARLGAAPGSGKGSGPVGPQPVAKSAAAWMSTREAIDERDEKRSMTNL
jgi:hypothetical protein